MEAYWAWSRVLRGGSLNDVDEKGQFQIENLRGSVRFQVDQLGAAGGGGGGASKGLGTGARDFAFFFFRSIRARGGSIVRQAGLAGAMSSGGGGGASTGGGSSGGSWTRCKYMVGAVKNTQHTEGFLRRYIEDK